MEQGIDGGRAFGGCGLIAAIVVLVFGALFGLVLVDGIEGSRADRAQARSAAEQAQAWAQAVEVRGEVDKAQIQANLELERQVNQLNYQLEAANQRAAEFERTYALAALAVANMDAREVNRLERLMGQGGASGLDVALAVLLAVVAFGLLVALQVVLRRYVNRRWEETWTRS